MIGASCAHLKISWRTEPADDGLTRGWWECDSGCGAIFTLRVAVIAENAALREERDDAVERVEQARVMLRMARAEIDRLTLASSALKGIADALPELIEWAESVAFVSDRGIAAIGATKAALAGYQGMIDRV